MRKIVIVGGGIVGCALAADLVGRDSLDITVIDASPAGTLNGSTGHAPGYVGAFHPDPRITALAQGSIRRYSTLALDGVAGFDRVGCLDLATTASGDASLRDRLEHALHQGVPVSLLTGVQAAALAPSLVDPARTVSALHFPDDGTARATVITRASAARAEAAGAQFLVGIVTAVETAGGAVTGVRLDGALLPADDVVLATNVWAPLLAGPLGVDLPVFPVAHPYVHGPVRATRLGPIPFVRWPDHFAYARDHGDRFGLGSYDHRPVLVSPTDLGPRADLAWPGELFDTPIRAAVELLPAADQFRPEDRLNGIYAMTPDDVPLVGPVHGFAGLWSAVAVSVTHAGGATSVLADLMLADDPEPGMAELLDPSRFTGHLMDDLQAQAVRRYRDLGD